MQDYRKLKVWQKAHHLVIELYKRTKDFPKDELYGVTSQLRRSAVSITANIVEGQVEKPNRILLAFYRCHLDLQTK